MSDTSDSRDTGPTDSALLAENERLRRENLRLLRQTQDVAAANAHAAELMVRLEETNEELLAEIEKRKAAEQKLSQINRQVEDVVQHRTAQLSQVNRRLMVEISQRQRIEDELRSSEERFRQVAESAGEFIWEVDAEGLYTYASPALEEMLGYSPQEVIGKKHFYDFLLPEELEDMKARSLAAFARREAFRDLVNSRAHKDGHAVILQTSGTPIVDPEGNLLGYRGADTDISGRKRAEAELAGKTALLEAQLNSTIDGILVVDLQGRKVLQNRRCIELWGIPADVVANNDDQRQVEFVKNRTKDPAKFVETVVYLYNHPDEVSRDEVEFEDGTILDRYSAPVTGVDGVHLGRIWLFHDITEHVRTQQQQTQLLQRMSEINQELKQFAYVVSHDLKAPLRGIRTLADWLAADYADKLDEQGKESLHLLGSRVDRMQGLIDGVLQYSRVGHTEEHPSPVDLGQIVPEVVTNLSAPEHISIRIETDLPTVEANPTRITQVFQNLLSNAVKYMDKPQGQIRIGCIEEDGFWRFSVSDNGPGIEAKYFDKLFRLFQTLTARDEHESTGVGLAIVKKIVEMYGGRVWVESQLGEGSTFLFTWPKSHEDVAHEKPQTSIAC